MHAAAHVCVHIMYMLQHMYGGEMITVGISPLSPLFEDLSCCPWLHLLGRLTHQLLANFVSTSHLSVAVLGL